jgi:hypothetical protein
MQKGSTVDFDQWTDCADEQPPEFSPKTATVSAGILFERRDSGVPN